MRKIWLIWCLVFPGIALAQWNIPSPVVAEGPYTITDTVYLAPDGIDTAAGTAEAPVQSFEVALDLLPFGEEGVNGGHAYGLIIFKAGHYTPENGFRQSVARWKQGNTYKNVSIEGRGDVTLGGQPEDFSKGHLVVLRGDHIYIKNLQLQYCDGIGLLLNRDPELGRQHHVLIDGVQVDSAGSFSMLLRNVDTITVRHSGSFHASRPGSDSLTSPCQWPSGIKFFGCSHARIHDSEIAYTRGEGLNFHNSLLGEAYGNRLHDNPTNLYNDNSAKLSLHHNHIYNTAGASEKYWRTCPADSSRGWAGAGLLIANEGACDRGNFPVMNNCRTRCSLPDETYPNVDSVFVYNNILQNTGSAFRFWQGVTDIPGVNCIRNVWIFNNTVLGIAGHPDAANGSVVSFFFPSYNIVFDDYYAYMEGVQMHGNIFAYAPEGGSALQAVRSVFHDFHPRPGGFSFSENVWVEDHEWITDGVVRPELPSDAPLFLDEEEVLLPCIARPEWVHPIDPIFPDLLENDFLYHPRSAEVTNAGALEFRENCTSSTPITAGEETKLIIAPNPVRPGQQLRISGPMDANGAQVRIYDVNGRLMRQGGWPADGILRVSPDWESSMYFLMVSNAEGSFTQKFIVLD